jgi:hypothetical protein
MFIEIILFFEGILNGLVINFLTNSARDLTPWVEDLR